MAGTIVNVSTIKNTVTVDTSAAMRKLKALKKELASVQKRMNFERSSSASKLAERKAKMEKNRLAAERKARKEKEKALRDKQRMEDAVSKDNLRNVKLEQKAALEKEKLEKRAAAEKAAVEKKNLRDYQRMQDAVSKDNLKNIKRENTERDKAAKREKGRRKVTRLGSLRVELAGLNTQSAALRDLNKKFHDNNMEVQEYNRRLDAMIRQQRRAENSTKSFGQRMKGLRSTFVQLTASMTAFSAGTDIVATGQTLERLEMAVKVATGSAKAAKEEMAFFNEVVSDTGVSLTGAAKGFKGFIVASRFSDLSMEESRRVFKSVSKASVAFGLTQEETEGSLKALSQMVSKATVSLEELEFRLYA